MPYQVVNNTPAVVSGITNGLTYRVQNTSSSEVLSKSERDRRPVVYYAEIDDGSQVDRAEHFELEPGDAATFKPISGKSIYVWTGSVSQDALLAISEV